MKSRKNQKYFNSLLKQYLFLKVEQVRTNNHFIELENRIQKRETQLLTIR